jgi:hypothetical protein
VPVPQTTDVGKLIEFFSSEHPEWPHKQVVAAALNTARRNGANIPNKLKRKRKS